MTKSKTRDEKVMASHDRIDLANLQNFLDWYWGWTLTRNGGPGSKPRVIGAWTTGWTLSGYFPGRGQDWIRYRSLREVAQDTGYYDHVSKMPIRCTIDNDFCNQE